MYRVAAGEIDDRLPGITPRKRFLALVVRQFRPPAHPHALGFGELTALASAPLSEYLFVNDLPLAAAASSRV